MESRINRKCIHLYSEKSLMKKLASILWLLQFLHHSQHKNKNIRAIFLLAKHFALFDCFVFVFCNPFSSFGSCCKTRNMIRIDTIDTITSITLSISSPAKRPLNFWRISSSCKCWQKTSLKDSLQYQKNVNVEQINTIKIKISNIFTLLSIIHMLM